MNSNRLGPQQLSSSSPAIDTTAADSPPAPWGSNLRFGLRWALRALRRRPTLSLTAVAVLAIAVVANALLLAAWQATREPLAVFTDPERLVSVVLDNAGAGTSSWPMGAERFVETRREVRSFTALAAHRGVRFDLSAPGEPERLIGARVSPELFSTLGVQMVLGRGFTDDPADETTAVISSRLFDRRFASDRGLLGNALTLDGRSYRVIGIAPPGMVIPGADTDVWIPLVVPPPERARALFYLRVVGRLAPGVDLATATAELTTIGDAIGGRFPDTDAGYLPRLTPLRQELFGTLDAPLGLLAVLGGLLSVLAGVNLAGLLAARATLRGTDDAVAVALGAPAGWGAQQGLFEGFWLAVGGLGVGLGGAQLLLPAASDLMLRANSRVAAVELDLPAALAGSATALAIALAAGWATGRLAARRPPIAALRAGSRTASLSRGAARTLAGLVAVEVALGTALLVPGLRLASALEDLLAVDPGFRAEQVVTFEVSGPRPGSPLAGEPATHFAQLGERLAALPGVEAVGAMQRLPLIFPAASSTQFSFEGQPVDPTRAPAADYRTVSPGLFAVLGTKLVAGRDFDHRDMTDSELVVMVNEAFVRRHVPSGNALDRRIEISSRRHAFRRIVGVVDDLRLGSLEHPIEPAIFVPLTQNNVPTALRSMVFLVRSELPPGELAPQLGAAVRSLDPSQAISTPRPLQEILDAALAPRRDQTRIVSALAGLAILLAALGIYGQASYVMSTRRHELALRVALGATSPRLLAQLLGDGLRLAGLGAIAGIVVAAATEPLLARLTTIAPGASQLLFAAPMLLLVVATLAFALPTLTATRTANRAAEALVRSA